MQRNITASPEVKAHSKVSLPTHFRTRHSHPHSGAATENAESIIPGRVGVSACHFPRTCRVRDENPIPLWVINPLVNSLAIPALVLGHSCPSSSLANNRHKTYFTHFIGPFHHHRTLDFPHPPASRKIFS